MTEEDRDEEKKELRKEFQRLSKLSKGLDEDLENLYSKSGLTPKQISDFLDNPKNFSGAQWELIQKEREKYNKKIYKAAGKEVAEKEEKKQQKKKSGKQRKKFLGKRRGWLQMD